MVTEVVEEGDNVVVVFEVIVHLLEAPHSVQDIELLPAFGKVYLSINEVWIPKMHKC